jgi:triphosphoribosyl-dephospho-CoA synthase CitG
MICPQSAVTCIRSHAHSQEEVLKTANKLLLRYKADRTNNWPEPVMVIGDGALEAMLMEVSCTPAPGLVDRFNSGAHSDMDFFTFLRSSTAINIAIYQCAMAGWQHNSLPEELLPILRRIGEVAEKKMLLVTQGVNTQRGLLFLLGIMAAAAALTYRKHREQFTANAVFTEAAAICKGIVDRELSSITSSRPDRQLTAGERLYLEYGVVGIRGEIEAGLPNIQTKGLPCFREALQAGLSVNDALVHALLGLMTKTQDTTILNRHDMKTLLSVQATANSIMADGGMLTVRGRNRIKRFDRIYSYQKRISPGGSADLLAATYFIDFVEKAFK